MCFTRKKIPLTLFFYKTLAPPPLFVFALRRDKIYEAFLSQASTEAFGTPKQSFDRSLQLDPISLADSLPPPVQNFPVSSFVFHPPPYLPASLRVLSVSRLWRSRLNVCV